MNIQEQIQVMRAYATGNKIQMRRAGSTDRWFDCDPFPQWNWEQCEYRIKPAPKKFWIVINPGGPNYAYEDESQAKGALENIKQYRNSQAYIVPVQGIVS